MLCDVVLSHVNKHCSLHMACNSPF